MSKAAGCFKLACKKSELRLDITLQCGQSFRWREVTPGKWRGIIGNTVWSLSQDDSHLQYQTHSPVSEATNQDKQIRPIKKLKKNAKTIKGISIVNEDKSPEDEVTVDTLSVEKYEAMLKDYFQLDLYLEEMYSLWSKADQNFAAVSHLFPGVRMLNQDPVENVFSFICSSNNNIQRITQLVDRLCKLYGSPLVTVDGTTWYSFPKVEALAEAGVEDTLRKQGFGYRAKFIHKSAQLIMKEGGEEWLHSLRSLKYEECHAQLRRLEGVGAKVSDCICLMSMGHLGAIPVDTHVFQIAARDYLPHLRSCKTVTDRVYKEIANHFRKVFGEYAGWAHSVLFSADLKKFETLKSEGAHQAAGEPKSKRGKNAGK